MNISYVICLTIEDTDIGAMRREGPISGSACIECAAPVVALDANIREAAMGGSHVAVPLCYRCAFTPKYRAMMRENPINRCSGVSDEYMRSFVAAARSQGGSGIN